MGMKAKIIRDPISAQNRFSQNSLTKSCVFESRKTSQQWNENSYGKDTFHKSIEHQYKSDSGPLDVPLAAPVASPSSRSAKMVAQGAKMETPSLPNDTLEHKKWPRPRRKSQLFSKSIRESNIQKPASLLEPILSTSGAKARKCSNRTSWNPFYRFLEPRRENT